MTLPLDTENVEGLPTPRDPELWRQVRVYTRSIRQEVKDVNGRLQNAVGQDTDWHASNLAGVGETYSRALSKAAGAQHVWDQAWETVANDGDLDMLEGWALRFATSDHGSEYSEPFLTGARKACLAVHLLIQASRQRPRLADKYTTVHVVVPKDRAENLLDFLEEKVGVLQDVLFAGRTSGVSADASTAGADPSSWHV